MILMNAGSLQHWRGYLQNPCWFSSAPLSENLLNTVQMTWAPLIQARGINDAVFHPNISGSEFTELLLHCSVELVWSQDLSEHREPWHCALEVRIAQTKQPLMTLTYALAMAAKMHLSSLAGDVSLQCNLATFWKQKPKQRSSRGYLRICSMNHYQGSPKPDFFETQEWFQTPEYRVV